MSNRTLALDDRIYRYLLEHSVREAPLMRELRELTLRHELARMQIAPEQGQFMALLVELLGAIRVIEIGTFTGYSALCMAQALPADGELICCDISEEWTAMGLPFWERAGVRDRIGSRRAGVDILPAQYVTIPGLPLDGAWARRRRRPGSETDIDGDGPCRRSR